MAEILDQKSFKVLFERSLEGFLTSMDFPLNEQIKEISMAGGKRIRPYLVYLCALQSGFDDIDTITNAGLVVELIHTASLIHDDLIDNSDFRRGKMTLHKRWDYKVAMLAGDLTLIRTFFIIDSLQDRIPSLLFESTSTLVEMVEGQVLEGACSQIKVPDIKTLEIINEKKTASLFGLAFFVGVSLASEDDEKIKRAKEAGRYFGLLFQLVDDLLDIFGTIESTGKSPLTDIKEGHLKIPYVFTYQKDPTILSLIREFRVDKKIEIAEEIKERIKKTARKEIVKLIDRYCVQLKDSLSKAFPVDKPEIVTPIVDNLYHKARELIG